jgi:hypothetical protein
MQTKAYAAFRFLHELGRNYACRIFLCQVCIDVRLQSDAQAKHKWRRDQMLGKDHLTPATPKDRVHQVSAKAANDLVLASAIFKPTLRGWAPGLPLFVVVYILRLCAALCASLHPVPLPKSFF